MRVSVIAMIFLLPIYLYAQSSAPVCGNGTVDPGEECDDGNNNSDFLTNHCRANCLLPHCGDGVMDAVETCDDGNNSDGDVCSSDCKESFQGKSRFEVTTPIDTPTSQSFDPDIALKRAVITTFFGPPGLGYLYGPSMGHFYAGEVGRGIGMTLARSSIVGLDIGLAFAVIEQKLPLKTYRNIGIASGLLFQALVAADLIDAPRAAKRANEKKKQEAVTGQ